MARYSPSKGGNWHEGVDYGDALPDDLVAVDDATWLALVHDSNTTGRPIVPGADGQPELGPALAPDLIAYAKAKQQALAYGGYAATVGGQPLPFGTDPESEFRLTGKALRLQQPGAPTADFTWPLASGAAVAISPSDFIAVAEKIADFVQGTSDVLLLTVVPGIVGQTITTTAQIDTAFAAVTNHD